MTKLKNPLLSLGAIGRLTKALTFTRRRLVNIVEKTPIPDDPRSLLQMSWRHMYQKAVILWHALSAAEKQEWQTSASIRHMTGFAWFMSQALRPNPGLYLPLQGGTMTGDIVMNGYHLHRLTSPIHFDDAARKAYVDAQIAANKYTEGCRAYHDADQNIPNTTETALAFNQERYDTDSIHALALNNSRLTCKTAGKYIITGAIYFAANAAGRRIAMIKLNGVTTIASFTVGMAGDDTFRVTPATIYDLGVGDYVELRVFQTTGGVLQILSASAYSPEFMMQRICS